MPKYLLFLITLLFYSQIQQAQEIYLHCGKFVDVKNGKVLKNKTIIVEGKLIKDILSGYQTPTDHSIKIINLQHKTVLPGLIDMHVHLDHEFNPNTYIERFTVNDIDAALQATNYTEKTLMAGFTTVRDLGSFHQINTALRNATAKGYIIGPRIYSAGKAIGTTGGHADPTNGVRKEMLGNPGPKQGVINGADEAKKAVRQLYKEGADVIKITATGGVLSVAKNGQNPQFTVDEVKAICATAKDYDMHVAAHAHGDEGMQRAILGGVKTIEHGTLMSEKTMDLMKQHDVYYVPTITAGKEVSDKAKITGYYPKIIVPKAAAIGPKIQGTFKKAYKKGVKIAFGTDAGVFPHGLNAKEFGFMVEAGMPAIEAIQSATIVNASVLKNDKIGQLTTGYFADIIAVDEDPTININTLEKVIFVMKEGVIYKN